jgi:two-component system chemotaxis response regulator CheY
MFKHVMLIDDDDVTLLICELRLKKSGFCDVVTSFLSGVEAINYFQNQAKLSIEKRAIPDLIFLDINMPAMSGWEFIDEYNNLAPMLPEIPIAILSSSVDPDDAEKASFIPSIKGFITKPLTDESLRKLNKLLA